MKKETFEVTEIIVEKFVKSLVELQALAHQQKKEGKTDLFKFLVNTTPRAVADILNTAWEIENAAEKLARSKKTPLELLQEVKEKECTEGCGGLWKICAEEILDSCPVQTIVTHFCSLFQTCSQNYPVQIRQSTSRLVYHTDDTQ